MEEQKSLKQILSLEDFDEKFPLVECSAHERTSSSSCICEELPDINEELVNIKQYIRSHDKQVLEAVEKEVNEIEQDKTQEEIELSNSILGEEFNKGYREGERITLLKVANIITKALEE